MWIFKYLHWGVGWSEKNQLTGDCESLIEMRGKASAWDLDFRETGPLPVFWCWLSKGILDGIRPQAISGGYDLVSCCLSECWPIVSWAFLWMAMLQQVLDAVGWPLCWRDWSSSWVCCCFSTSLYAALTFSAMPSVSLEARPQVRDYFGCAQLLWTFHCLFCQSNSSLCCKKQV